MKRIKPSVLLLTAIILLVITLHYKLHRQDKNISRNNTGRQTNLGLNHDQPIFPSVFYRVVEIGRY